MSVCLNGGLQPTKPFVARLPNAPHQTASKVICCHTRSAFWKRVNATIAKGDAFGDAVALWRQHQNRDGDRLALRIQQAWLERDGQGEMDI